MYHRTKSVTWVDEHIVDISSGFYFNTLLRRIGLSIS